METKVSQTSHFHSELLQSPNTVERLYVFPITTNLSRLCFFETCQRECPAWAALSPDKVFPRKLLSAELTEDPHTGGSG